MSKIKLISPVTKLSWLTSILLLAGCSYKQKVYIIFPDNNKQRLSLKIGTDSFSFFLTSNIDDPVYAIYKKGAYRFLRPKICCTTQMDTMAFKKIYNPQLIPLLYKDHDFKRLPDLYEMYICIKDRQANKVIVRAAKFDNSRLIID